MCPVLVTDHGPRESFWSLQRANVRNNNNIHMDGVRSLSRWQFFWDEIKTLGTAACPPYHLAIVIGGLSAELTLKTVKMASAK